MTKKEILKKAMNVKYCGSTRFHYLDEDESPLIYKAMDEYAKQEAIAFEKWLRKFDYTCADGIYYIDMPQNGISGDYNIEQLFDLFKQKKLKTEPMVQEKQKIMTKEEKAVFIKFILVVRHARNVGFQVRVEDLRSEAVIAERNAERILGKKEWDRIQKIAFM